MLKPAGSVPTITLFVLDDGEVDAETGMFVKAVVVPAVTSVTIMVFAAGMVSPAPSWTVIVPAAATPFVEVKPTVKVEVFVDVDVLALAGLGTIVTPVTEVTVPLMLTAGKVAAATAPEFAAVPGFTTIQLSAPTTGVIAKVGVTPPAAVGLVTDDAVIVIVSPTVSAAEVVNLTSDDETDTTFDGYCEVAVPLDGVSVIT